MLQPPQVQAWPDIAKSDPTVRTAYHGYGLGETTVTFAESPKFTAPTERRGTLQSPAKIFGKPVDESCLHGIGSWPVHARAPHCLDLPDARVIGASAALGQDGRVYTPEDITASSKQAFIAENAFGHQRFLIEDVNGHAIIRFPQRKVPKRHPLNAAFFYNIEPGNFGSFMFRVFPQLVQAKNSDKVFDCYITPERTPFMLEALDLLGLPRRPIFTVGEVCGDFFDSIAMFCVDDAEGYLDGGFLSHVRGLARDLASKRDSGSPAPRRIYVSRALSACDRPWYRVMLNEADIELVAQARGFTVVYPETLRLEDQIVTFMNAELVIGPSGSGMFNVMFSAALKKIVDIETFHVTVRQHAKLYTSCGAEYSFLFTSYADGEGKGGLDRPYVCPPSLVTEAIDWLCAGS